MVLASSGTACANSTCSMEENTQASGNDVVSVASTGWSPSDVTAGSVGARSLLRVLRWYHSHSSTTPWRALARASFVLALRAPPGNQSCSRMMWDAVVAWRGVRSGRAGAGKVAEPVSQWAAGAITGLIE